MNEFESGVSGYVHCIATVDMHFPVDARGNAYIQCDMCRFYRRSTNRCNLTDEIILNPNKYVGNYCPMQTITDKEN